MIITVPNYTILFEVGIEFNMRIAILYFEKLMNFDTKNGYIFTEQKQ